jgi:nicotinamidase-related amidase
VQHNNETALTIDSSKTALLLLHWQNDIAVKDSEHSGNNPERLAVAHTIEHTQAVLKASRKKGVLVVYVNASHRLSLKAGIHGNSARKRSNW